MSQPFLPDDPALSTEQEARLDALCDRFEDAWKAGGRPRLEEYLADAPEPERAAVALDLLRVETYHRRQVGEEPQPADYQARLSMLSLSDIAGALAPAPPACEGHTQLELGGGPGAPPDQTSDQPPTVPGYEVLGELGRGGMGVVYQAVDTRLGRPVALKFLRPEISRDAEALERFLREARTASSLNHPNIGTVYALEEHEGQPYLAMEFVEGQTLRALAAQPVPLPALIPLIQQAARALCAAHAAGIVHRDIKPENLVVRSDGLVKVLDFGLARLLPANTAQVLSPSGRLTNPGMLVGTLHYMAPEQARAEPVGPAADIFALGLIFYELAVGRHPFPTERGYSVLQAIIAEEPAAAARLNPEIPAAVDDLIQRMLAKDPCLRPTAPEVDATLTELPDQRDDRPRSSSPRPARQPTVGRQHERATLQAGFESAAAGRGLLLCVTGEPGLGKTTLVEDFLEELAAGGRPHGVARGRCFERLAGAEAYLPVLEALDSLVRGAAGAAAAQAMRQLAPSWYAQIVPPGAGEQPTDQPSSQARLKREMLALLTEVSRVRPLVVFLDDVHWADPSSVDLLAYLGGKCTELSLLLVLTYRPSDLMRSQHPFGPVKLELQGRGVCREIALPFLSRDDLDRYLALAFAGHQFPEELAAVLHARTEGNPLFMVDLLRYLGDQGVIVQDHGTWALVRTMPDLQRELPESVRGMIRRKVDQLSEADRHLLMVASVMGPEFGSVGVSEVLGRETGDVEERLAVLESGHGMVRLVGERLLPDGMVTVRYGFVHVLYQNALYAAIQPTRKATWSAAAAQTLLDHYGEKSGDRAADLAVLFEVARDHERAADHYLVAAENAGRVFAHHEAVVLARRGLARLQTLPDTPERARREIPMQVTLGMQLQIAQGFAAPEAERIYARARALFKQVREAPPLFPVLWGLWMYYEVRGEPGKSWELAEQLFTLAQKAQDPAQFIQARQALAITSLCLGDPVAAREHVEQGVALYDAKRHGSHTYLYGQDPGVGCLAFGAVALWLLGYPDQAVLRSREAVALGGKSGQPSTLALALHFAAILRQYRREGPAVHGNAEAAMAIATEHGFSFWLSGALIMRGWALAEQGAWADGIAQLHQGLTSHVATGAETYRTYYLALLADALGMEGKIEQGLSALAEALALMDGTGEGYHGAELHRLRGEFLLRQTAAEGACREAEACFRRALTLARRQQAKSLELRAAMSLSRLYQKQGRQAEARPLLAECYDWFTEGFDTPDLQDAKALLEHLS